MLHEYCFTDAPRPRYIFSGHCFVRGSVCPEKREIVCAHIMRTPHVHIWIPGVWLAGSVSDEAAIRQCTCFQFRLSYCLPYFFLSVCSWDLGLWSIAGGMCEMEVAKPASQSPPRPTCRRTVCQGFALIFLIRTHLPGIRVSSGCTGLLFISPWWNGPEPRPPHNGM